MRQVKPNIIKFMILALSQIFIAFFDYLYRVLFHQFYNPFVSLISIAALVLIFISAYNYWYFRPYSTVIQMVHKYYNELLGEIALSSDAPKSYSLNKQLDSLEQLIHHFRSSHKQQKDLVCQLTNKNNILDQNNRFANAIVQITSEILHSGDIHSILQLILDKAIEIIPNAQKGSILLYNKEYLEYKAMYGYDIDALKDFRFSFNEIFQFKAKNLYEPIIINNVEEFNRNLNTEKFILLKDSKSFELKSCISCAISIDNQFYGTINIDNIENNHAFIDEHKPIIKYFAEQIGVALKNALLIERILQLSQYDSLTSICNRSFFEEQLGKVHEKSIETNQNYSLVIIDLNDLKFVNDSYGHEAGDRLIKTFTTYISEIEEKPDVFGRIGGDEFALVYTNKTKEQVNNIIESIKLNFANEAFRCDDKDKLHITFGYGTCCFPHEAEDIATLFKNADMLMYMEKKRSKEVSQWKHLNQFSL